MATQKSVRAPQQGEDGDGKGKKRGQAVVEAFKKALEDQKTLKAQ